MKMKSKKVTFLIVDHWENTMHMIERWLDVAIEHEVEGDSFYAHQHKADEIVEEIKTNSSVIERLRLAPAGYEVDVSLHVILMAYKDSVVRIELIDRRTE